ncbi:SRPBCC family protein [Amycolatopsis sp. cmx-4-54]|uniref:SRPBCC family protein n=1 Tax=Amycolatopsis sp. cmx-4-54 TaxID=2790936 RepID=UPI00397D19BB
MVEVTRSFTVSATPNAVTDYLKDFSRAVEWDPGTVTCEQTSVGPIAVGTRWHNVSKIGGMETELTYELTRLEPGRVVFVGANDTATSTDDITITAGDQPDTSTPTYHASIEFAGAAKLAAPIAKMVFEKLGNDTEDNLVRIFGSPKESH